MLLKSGLTPDTDTFSVLAKAYSLAGDINGGLEVCGNTVHRDWSVKSSNTINSGAMPAVYLKEVKTMHCNVALGASAATALRYPIGPGVQ